MNFRLWKYLVSVCLSFIVSNHTALTLLLFTIKRFLQKLLFDLPEIVTSWCSLPIPQGLHLAVRGGGATLRGPFKCYKLQFIRTR